MGNTLNMKVVLDFLGGLNKHNDRTWFEAHRADYERAQHEFEEFITQVIEKFGEVEDLSGVRAKDSIMRIYRDVRFSKDKSPYKTGFGASIGTGGRKSGKLPYHLHIQPGNHSMAAGGLYMPEPAQLNRFRAAIDKDTKRFKAIIAAPDFKKAFGALGGEMLKTAPQGYAKDHPEIDLLKHKQVTVVHPLSDEALVSSKVVQEVVGTFKAMKPFIDYLNEVSR